MRLVLELLIKGYDLIVIEDEATPLAKRPIVQNYYFSSLYAIAVLLLAILFVVWVVKRVRIKRHLRELIAKSGDKSRKIPLLITKIEDAIKALEAELVDSMLEGIDEDEKENC